MLRGGAAALARFAVDLIEDDEDRESDIFLACGMLREADALARKARAAASTAKGEPSDG